VCLGLPGSLPVLNEKAVELALRLGEALDFTMPARSIFHRKNYFYPDMPKNFQTSQYDEPICVQGEIEVDGVRVRITRAHLEEDTGKTMHVGGGGRIHDAEHSLVDYNRAGVPLLEIVSEPDIRSAEQARAYVTELRATLLALGVSDVKMEEGSMRVDANVSLRRRGTSELGTKVEVKNMNSFNFAAQGIRKEVERQIEIYERGGVVEQETLHFDPTNEDSPPLRSKEEAQDYRYFPEPDLVPVHPPADVVERLSGEIGELPATRIGRIARTLSFYDADVLVTGGLDRLWSAVVDEGVDPKETANVLANAFVAAGVDPENVDPRELAKLVAARASIQREAFDEALAHGGDEGFSAEPYLAQKTVSDVGALDPILDEILAANPGEVAGYRSGKEGLLGFFVGQVMKATGGKADPRVVNERLREKLQA